MKIQFLLCQNVLKKKINKFIFASSCSVYGNVKYECNEKSKLNPVSLYAKNVKENVKNRF